MQAILEYSTDQKKPNRERKHEQERNGYRTSMRTGTEGVQNGYRKDTERIQNRNGTDTERIRNGYRRDTEL